MQQLAHAVCARKWCEYSLQRQEMLDGRAIVSETKRLLLSSKQVVDFRTSRTSIGPLYTQKTVPSRKSQLFFENIAISTTNAEHVQSHPISKALSLALSAYMTCQEWCTATRCCSIITIVSNATDTHIYFRFCFCWPDRQRPLTAPSAMRRARGKMIIIKCPHRSYATAHNCFSCWFQEHRCARAPIRSASPVKWCGTNDARWYTGCKLRAFDAVNLDDNEIRGEQRQQNDSCRQWRDRSSIFLECPFSASACRPISILSACRVHMHFHNFNTWNVLHC